MLIKDGQKMKLTIPTDTPSLKNSKQIFRTRSGRPFITSSNRSKEWRIYAVALLRQQAEGRSVERYPVSLTITFFRSTRRRFDLDNAMSSCADALVDAGIIEDDNMNCVNKITAAYGGVDKLNPRAEIFIED